MPKYINLASHDVKMNALAEKLERVADGLYCPKDLDEWVEMFNTIKTSLIQSDRVKLFGLLKDAVRRWYNQPYFAALRS